MKTNPLGDIRAENDHVMLDQVFYETPDYRSLLEDHIRRIVVGRRGTGKSALFYKLKHHWDSEAKTAIVEITPSETEIIGLRPIIAIFGPKHSYIRAASTIAWQYALLQEILSTFSNHYKVRSEQEFTHLPDLARLWRRGGDNVAARLFHALEMKVDMRASVEKRVATLAQTLEINNLTALAGEVLNIAKFNLRIIADRLDEGYEPDVTGVAMLTGLVYAFDKLSSAIPNTSTTVFLRDNIFRAIQAHDPDYSRNLEGDVLRLHWDEYHLFNMICNRIRQAFDIKQQKNLRVWNQVTARDLEGMDGFRQCLRLTLYRPRDLLSLLNSAFNHARSHHRDTIVNDDIEASAREISCSRLDDLKKEYREVIPGITRLITAFSGGNTVLSSNDVQTIIDRLPATTDLLPAEGQTLAIINSPEDVIRTLYSVGFLGVWNPSISSYVFCHDGKAPDFAVDVATKVLVHPCYCIALSLKEEKISLGVLEEIHDEYDIEVTSETPEIRKRKLGQIIDQLRSINEGEEDAGKFEEWCLQAVSIVFATGIVNIELHPNKNSTQRRDVVGRNTGKTETWGRIHKDYGARQIVFEVKNFSSDLGPNEYRQMLSYLCGEHGRIGFIINRSEDANLHKDRELQWVREIYHEHERRVVVKLPASLLISWLSKLRNPQKHDAPDKGLGSLLDTYERLYVRLGGAATLQKRKGKKSEAKNEAI